MSTRPQPNRPALEAAVEAFLRALGHDLSGELVGTPERVASAWIDELLEGEQQSPRELLAAAAIELPEGTPRDVVVLRDVAITLVCPHHLLPAHGRASVAFVPAGFACGLGAIAAAARAATRRLVLQEVAGAALAADVVAGLGARAAAVRLVLSHGCLTARGEREHHALVETLSLAGTFADPASPDRALLGFLFSSA